MSIFIKPKAVKITLLQRVMRLSTAAALKRCSYYKLNSSITRFS